MIRPEEETEDSDEFDWRELSMCQTCYGQGVDCCDDLCANTDRCIHGDGEITCPECHGEGEV